MSLTIEMRSKKVFLNTFFGRDCIPDFSSPLARPSPI